ncbi:MAG TPA: glycosyltransferase family 25 protein [Cytophagaceae bacterium]|jgi:GR25 family glycosyltransferase involved in LPS biosynthesis|nr:glycosyltransferase family 25 protein [Cytophagaceae bacterium]
MSTINTYFDNVYLINLDRRRDRLELATKECNRQGIKFERFNAVDGLFFDDYVKYDDKTADEKRWTNGAAALVETTRLILLDAIEKKYDNILILEDDLEFNPNINKVFEENYQDIPSDWETFYFGLIHMKPYKMVSKKIARVSQSFCCHCYAINGTFFEYMLELISKIEKPIDHYTFYDIQPREKSYCFVPNLAYQKADYSDIGMESVHHPALRNNYF